MTGLLTALAIQTSAVVSVAPDGFGAAKEPQIAIDADRSIHVAFGVGNAVYVSQSTDAGKTYLPPTLVSNKGQLALGMRRGPRITAFRGTITVSAVVGEQGKGRDGDLVAWKSTNRGKTWSGPSRVNDVEGSAREGLHAMAVSPQGEVACVWLDLRGQGTKLYAAFSGDGGTTWRKNQLVYESPSGTICQCCHPSIVYREHVEPFVMFRNVLDGDRDMYVTTTTSKGSFGPPKKLGNTSWAIDRCPMDGGMIDARNGLRSVWQRNGSIYCTSSRGDETLLGQGKQPWVASSADELYMVWMSGRRIMGLKDGGTPFVLSEQGDDPVIAASPDGKLLVAAWTENGIKAAVLRS